MPTEGTKREKKNWWENIENRDGSFKPNYSNVINTPIKRQKFVRIKKCRLQKKNDTRDKKKYLNDKEFHLLRRYNNPKGLCI